ncbi:MAG: acetate kinase [Rhodobacterales bacterium]|nr:MAG: acetate kinase [Rhodobacterales bacterium]
MTLYAIVNCGSSSIKFRVLDIDSGKTLADGLVEGIGEASGKLRLKLPGGTTETAETIADHRAGLDRLFAELRAAGVLDAGGLACIGHRVVHGGEAFTAPALIDQDVLDGIRAQIPLAPLHNPANITGIEAAMAVAPDIPHVAVFDTAFHQTMPPQAYRYAVPNALYDDLKVRRYGFHGTSHACVSRAAAEWLGIPLEAFNAVVLHLGNGASVTAIEGGKSVDTSMGLTPLEGLMMGTRSGDIDPALPHFMASNAGMSIGEIDTMLNRESGMKGICGDNDMRNVEARMEAGDEAARLAFDMFSHRARKYLGAYMALLGRVDAVVFTAGIGENSPLLRAAICDGLEPLGIALDPARNKGRGGPKEISTDASRTKLLVIPTEEELEIARQAKRCLEHAG